MVIFSKAWDLGSTYQLCSRAALAASPLPNLICSVDIWFRMGWTSWMLLWEVLRWMILCCAGYSLPGLLVTDLVLNIISNAKKWLEWNSKLSSGKETNLELEFLSASLLNLQVSLELREPLSLSLFLSSLTKQSVFVSVPSEMRQESVAKTVFSQNDRIRPGKPFCVTCSENCPGASKLYTTTIKNRKPNYCQTCWFSG